MKELAQLLKEMQAAGVIKNYAMFGAIAQMRYTEPVATFDADLLIAVPAPERLDVLKDIYKFCSEKGFSAEGEAVRVGAWPVQFIPVFSPLTNEAVEKADVGDFDGMSLRVVRPDYLAVIALSVGRAKDFTRILALLESKSVTAADIEKLAARFNLAEAWQKFQKRILNG